MPPFVSIILPCRNEAKHIATCWESISRQELVDGGFEVIVADGMSDDGTREVLRQIISNGTTGLQDNGTMGSRNNEKGGQRSVVSRPLSVVRSHLSPPLCIIDNPGKIVSTGVNAAIRAAHGDIIVRLDAHTEYALDYVQQCVAVLEETGADNVGGPARTKADSYMQEAVAAAYHSPFAVGGARFHNPNYEGYVDTVTYGCWRKSAFEKFGYFDEELIRNQDDEHNLRIIRGGGKVYQSPKIKSWYKPRGSLGALFKQYMQYGYWKVRVIQKHKLPASWRHLVPGAFVLALLLLALGSLFTTVWPAMSIPFTIFGFQFSAFNFAFVAALSSYLLALLAASVITARKTEWKLLPILPLVFPCYHFGYGWGFLRGIWDFVIRRKGASKNLATLSR